MEGEPLDEVQWRSPEWIQMFGLRTDNVLDYFSQSPFFDRGSNNQVLKMQSQFNEAVNRGPGGGPGGPGGGTNADFYNELRNMRGVEFVVAISREPDLWVIRKQTRLSPQETRPLATYFVIGENIYMAPSVHSVVTSRLLSTALCLNKALAKAARLPGFSPSQGYFYKNENNPISFASSSSSSASAAASANITSSSTGTGTGTPTPGASGKLASRSVAATPATTSTPSNTSTSGGGGSGSGNPSSTGVGSAAAGVQQPPGPNGLPLTAAAERLAFYNIDRALSYSVSNTTVYIDDPVLVTAAAAGAAGATSSGGAGSTQPAQQVNPAGAAAALSASPSSTDLKAKAAMNNQAAATVKRRRKPLR